MTSGMMPDSDRAELTALGVAESVAKPCGPQVLIEAVQRALRK